MSDWAWSQPPASCLMARCAIQYTRLILRKVVFSFLFFFFEGHVQKWICTLARSQFLHSNSLEIGMRAGSCVNTQLCRHWNTSWCMGWFACSFCFYSALIPHAFVQRRSHSCAGKLSVVSVHLPFSVGFSRTIKAFWDKWLSKEDSRLVSSYSKQSCHTNES